MYIPIEKYLLYDGWSQAHGPTVLVSFPTQALLMSAVRIYADTLVAVLWIMFDHVLILLVPLIKLVNILGLSVDDHYVAGGRADNNRAVLERRAEQESADEVVNHLETRGIVVAVAARS